MFKFKGRYYSQVIVIICIIIIFTSNGFSTIQRPDNAKFVWLNEHGKGRQQMVCFRNDFQLKKVPDSLKLHLFADSRYHLSVNGQFVNFGPVRFFPENPFYDSYDIAPYLQKGKNLVAVKVLSNGMNTFQTPKSLGGFISWGKSSDQSKQDIDFATPGNWLCKKINGLDSTAPKMSFALGPVEIYDARKDSQNWDKIAADLSTWQKPVLLNKQDKWAKLEKRILPDLTQKETLPKSLCGKYKLKNQEDIYFFRVNAPDLTREQFGENYRAFAYTYIYSPKKQIVEIGRWWGEFWLNGEGPLKGEADSKIPNRINSKIELKKGWNYLFIKYGIVWGCWDFYLALPKAAGLELSTSKTKNSKNIFMTAGPFQQDEKEKVHSLELPFESPADLPQSLSADWKAQSRQQTGGNPAWEVAWSRLGKKADIRASKVKNLTAEYSDGTAFVFDMGGKKLGRIFVEYEAPAGTILDIGFAEALDGNKPRILKRAGLYTGTRFITSENTKRLETFKPYGLRYMQINVKNADDDQVKITKTGVVSQRYPFEKKGSFQCSDPMFNDIWEMGWRTLLVCSEDTYTDTPFRERGTYAGDALPQYAITLATSGDSRLLKQSMEHFSWAFADQLFPDKAKEHYIRQNSGENLSDYPLLTLELLRWYVEYTGDIEFARKLYPGYKNLCQQMLEKENDRGVYEHGRVFIEWTQIDKDATLTTMQALLARSFENLAVLAGLLERESEKIEFSETAQDIRQMTRAKCWDEDKDAYRDGFKNGEPLESWYPISSAWPVNFNVTDQEQNRELEEHFRETLADIGSRNRHRKTTPYGGFYILGALYKLGHCDIAEKFIRKYWSPMILKYNDTAWENFGDTGGQGTLSHAWSGGPTYYMTTEILGVKLGFPYQFNPDTIRIEPQAESIDWAAGTVPHPQGKIKVSWNVKGEQLFLDYCAPSGVKCIVNPRGRLADKRLWINGELKAAN